MGNWYYWLIAISVVSLAGNAWLWWRLLQSRDFTATTVAIAAKGHERRKDEFFRLMKGLREAIIDENVSRTVLTGRTLEVRPELQSSGAARDYLRAIHELADRSTADGWNQPCRDWFDRLCALMASRDEIPFSHEERHRLQFRPDRIELSAGHFEWQV